MPTYEYRCADCGHRVEVFQRIDEEPLTVCERCGGPLRKVFHPAGIVFKGSGFYATDSRAAPKKKEETAGAGSGKSETSEKKTESGEGKGKGAPAKKDSEGAA